MSEGEGQPVNGGDDETHTEEGLFASGDGLLAPEDQERCNEVVSRERRIRLRHVVWILGTSEVSPNGSERDGLPRTG